ncbi:TonB-dependent receptor [Hyphomonas neptunium ATCC 15444]|uniref:TonB-dependent receptor n=2 Tax=Hyphomonas TaxID=85 RepID=Q0C0S0_HYPNA|nr:MULTISPECIES: TonB-dependent receptor [Hyphomonas]ABI78036.1 TonB-dependent receptor [Hyphomonas neptunium ATCC 15444]KCZ88238.1 TonB-dependent receptor [Hyphomonas hirschiana VP5]
MKRTLLLTALSSHILTGLALAQETDTPRVEAPIIVTAPGPARSSDELIGNATALDRADIIGRLSGTLGDTLSGEPGVSSTFFGQGASRPVLRGLGAERVQVLTNGIGVIDVSAASPDHQVAADGIDADKIEILRGPAALAYGGQAIGGVVNVIDGLIVETLPERAVSGEAYGAYNGVNDGTELGGRAAFTAGPLVFSLSASKREFGDYDIPGLAESRQLRHREELEHEAEEAAEGEDHEHEEEALVEGSLPNSFLDTETFGGGISWVGERAFAGFAVRQQTSKYGLPGHSHAHGEEEHDHEDGEDHEDEEHDHDHAHEEEGAPFIDLKQTRYDFRAGINLDGPVLKAVTGTLSYSDYEHSEVEGDEASSVFKSDGVEGRVELDHALAGFEGAVGLQFLDKSLDASGGEAFLTPTDTTSWAVFLYETRDWDSGFGIEGGLRVEQLEHDNAVAGKAEFDLYSASAGVHQHFGDGWFGGAQVAYTERGPNESELFAFGPHLATEQFEVGDANLDKERGLNLEGTLRWRGDKASFGANVFHTSFSDFIYLAPGSIEEDGELVTEEDGLPVFAFSQEDATLYGGEIYGEYYINQGPLGADWKFRSGIDYVRGELDGGENLPFIPPLRVTAGADADWQRVMVGASVEWADNQRRVGEGQLGTGDYTLVNLKTALKLSEYGIGREGTQFFVEVRNIADEEARLATSVLRDTVPLPGRNLRAGLRYTF